MNVKSWPLTGFRQLQNCPQLASGQPLKYTYQTRTTCEKMEDSNMPRVKQASKKKRVITALPALGAAGLTFSLVGGASAAVAPVNDQPQTPNNSPSHQITLGEEEIADVSLATFYVFDKESSAAAKHGVQEARGCGCRGCGGRGCRGCGFGCGGCGGCGWCLSTGGCGLC